MAVSRLELNFGWRQVQDHGRNSARRDEHGRSKISERYEKYSITEI